MPEAIMWEIKIFPLYNNKINDKRSDEREMNKINKEKITIPSQKKRWSFKAILTSLLAFCTFAGASVKANEDILVLASDLVTDGFDLVWPEELERGDVRMRFGLGYGFKPDYLGSNNLNRAIVPLIEINVQNKLLIQGTKIRYNVTNHQLLRVGPLLNYKVGRKEKANDALMGLGSIKDTVEIGLFAEGRWHGLLYSGSLRKALGASQGTIARALVGHGLYQDDKTLAIVGLRVFWGNAKNNQTNFGISEQQAARTDYDVFRPGSGLNLMEAALYGRYQFMRNVRIEGVMVVGKIIGNRAFSPLIAERGDDYQFSSGVGIRIDF